MGLIKDILTKTAGVGVMVAGLPFAPIGLAVEIPLAIKSSKEADKFENIESQSKLVCALSDKLAKEMEQLSSPTFDVGDYVVSSAIDETKQKEYAQMYDYVVNSFGELEAVTLISKDEFVNFMLENGKYVEEYIASEEFMDRLNELKTILQDETTTQEEKLHILKTSIEKDNHHCGPEMSTLEKVAIVALIVVGCCQSFSAVFSLFMAMDVADQEGFWAGVISYLLGPLSSIGLDMVLDY